MSELHPEPTDGPTDGPTDETNDRPTANTGSPAVDAVLASLERLDERPVAEHVAVFEAAHEALRGALADAGGRPTA